jgi:hypothetical protein
MNQSRASQGAADYHYGSAGWKRQTNNALSGGRDRPSRRNQGVLLAPTLVSADVDCINELFAVWFDHAQFSRQRKGPAVFKSGRSVRAIDL